MSQLPTNFEGYYFISLINVMHHVIRTELKTVFYLIVNSKLRTWTLHYVCSAVGVFNGTVLDLHKHWTEIK